MAANNFSIIVTGDESWFTFDYPHSAKWTIHREEAPERARQQIDTRQIMFIIILGVGGFPVIDLMTSQRSFDSQYFMNDVVTLLIANLFLQGRISHARRLNLYLDNARVHFSKITE
jgi:hypothetical protein